MVCINRNMAKLILQMTRIQLSIVSIADFDAAGSVTSELINKTLLY